MIRNNLLDHRRVGDMITPVLFQPYDFQASSPVKFIKENSSDLCPVSPSPRDLGRQGACGPGAEDRVRPKDHGDQGTGHISQ